jgi:DNA repair protein RecN (Recombination protein N)
VTLQQLSELGDLLIEIHGQNEHIRLVHSKEQFRLLDDHGAHNKKLETVERGYQEWKKLELEKQLLLDESPLDAGDSELLQYQVRELDDAMLPPGKLQALETEHRRLARGSELMAALEFARRSLESDKTGIGDTLNAAIDRLQEYASLDPLIDEAMKLLNEAAINCDEARNSIQGAISGMDLSPERLLEVENKLSMQHDLARKHRVQPEQLGEVLNKLKERLERAGSLDKRLSAIDPKLDQALQSYRKKAQALHQARHSRAAILSKAVSSLMQELGMQGGRFEFEVQYDGSASPTSGGNDRLELRVSANPGTPPGPLRKVASGGELSRISLAIKVASKCGDPAQTQVFDEVDAGIGGDTANAVGALLKSLSVGGQALCVTHLAQVAVCADHQFQVHKASEDQATRVETSLLAEKERVDEIARMLGGRLSDQSRAHATELLAIAATRH